MQPGIEPQRARAQEDAAEDQPGQREVERLERVLRIGQAAREIFEGQAERAHAAPRMHRLAVDVRRHLEEVREHEDDRGDRPARAPAETADQFPLQEAAEDGLLQRCGDDRRDQREQHAAPRLHGRQRLAGEAHAGQLEADDGLDRYRRDDHPEQELLPRIGVPRPERAQLQPRTKEPQGRDRGDQQRAVHRAVERDRPDHTRRVIDHRPEDHRAEQDDGEEDGQDELTGHRIVVGQNAPTPKGLFSR